jgi:hypothetical protein
LINDPIMLTDNGLYEAAKKFGQDVTAGLVKVAEPQQDAEAVSAADDTPY